MCYQKEGYLFDLKPVACGLLLPTENTNLLRMMVVEGCLIVEVFVVNVICSLQREVEDVEVPMLRG